MKNEYKVGNDYLEIMKVMDITNNIHPDFCVDVEFYYPLSDKEIREMRIESLYVKFVDPDQYTCKDVYTYRFKKYQFLDVYSIIIANSHSELVNVMISKIVNFTDVSNRYRLEFVWTC